MSCEGDVDDLKTVAEESCQEHSLANVAAFQYLTKNGIRQGAKGYIRVT